MNICDVPFNGKQFYRVARPIKSNTVFISKNSVILSLRNRRPCSEIRRMNIVFIITTTGSETALVTSGASFAGTR